MSLNWTEINKEITVFKKCIFLVSASVKLCITKLSGTGGIGAYLSEYGRNTPEIGFQIVRTTELAWREPLRWAVIEVVHKVDH
jgi:hypothetical protein